MYTERTHGAGALRKDHIGQTVVLCGWARRVRDMGGMVFVDLADRSGLCQVAFDPDMGAEAHAAAKRLGLEYVLAVRGEVAARGEKNVNPDLPTGAVEVVARQLEILSPSEALPFTLDDSGPEAGEETRLKYRFLDLRRPAMQQHMILRHQLMLAARNHLAAEGFLEIETPMLTKPTPEGARDFLVPSRMHRGKVYALPQSPQLFKQILQVAGYEKYMQIVRCFRDEDLRGDRQPEFTQIDLEMSFVGQEQVMAMAERCMLALFQGAGVTPPAGPILRLTYREAMDGYGSDKPDLRFALKFVDATDLARGTGFRVVADALTAGGRLTVLPVPRGAALSRKDLDALTEIAKRHGAGGLLWMKTGAEASGPMAKVWDAAQLAQHAGAWGIATDGLALAVVGAGDAPLKGLGAVRLEVARRLGLIPKDTWSLLWVVDFPAFERDEENCRYVAMHHPFTAPFDEDLPYLESEPTRVRAQTYDLVLNGNEIAGGSIRIHRSEVQARVFKAIGLSDEEARAKFGFLLSALSFGAPPHGGIAFGFDRVVALFAGRDQIRDVIAFPKTTSGTCLMTGAPGEPDAETLRRDLGLRLAE